MSDTQRNYTEKEAAKQLGVSQKTLQAWRFLGKGPVYLKLGWAVRYPARSLEEYERANLIEPRTASDLRSRGGQAGAEG